MLNPADNWYSSMQILDALSNSIDTPEDSRIIVLPSTNGFVTEDLADGGKSYGTNEVGDYLVKLIKEA